VKFYSLNWKNLILGNIVIIKGVYEGV